MVEAGSHRRDINTYFHAKTANRITAANKFLLLTEVLSEDGGAEGTACIRQYARSARAKGRPQRTARTEPAPSWPRHGGGPTRIPPRGGRVPPCVVSSLLSTFFPAGAITAPVSWPPPTPHHPLLSPPCSLSRIPASPTMERLRLRKGGGGGGRAVALLAAAAARRKARDAAAVGAPAAGGKAAQPGAASATTTVGGSSGGGCGGGWQSRPGVATAAAGVAATAAAAAAAVGVDVKPGRVGGAADGRSAGGPPGSVGGASGSGGCGNSSVRTGGGSSGSLLMGAAAGARGRGATPAGPAVAVRETQVVDGEGGGGGGNGHVQLPPATPVVAPAPRAAARPAPPPSAASFGGLFRRRRPWAPTRALAAGVSDDEADGGGDATGPSGLIADDVDEEEEAADAASVGTGVHPACGEDGAGNVLGLLASDEDAEGEGGAEKDPDASSHRRLLLGQLEADCSRGGSNGPLALSPTPSSSGTPPPGDTQPVAASSAAPVASTSLPADLPGAFSGLAAEAAAVTTTGAAVPSASPPPVASSLPAGALVPLGDELSPAADAARRAAARALWRARRRRAAADSA